MSSDVTFSPAIDHGVVVGLDGSATSLRALEWAWREALTRRVPLHVVRAWSLAGALPEVGAPPGIVPSLEECARAVESESARLVNRMRLDAGLGDASPALYLHVVHGHPGEVLVAAAARADLIVVGHRGHNRLALLLGSVATHVLAHARCPVVVLPEAADP